MQGPKEYAKQLTASGVINNVHGFYEGSDWYQMVIDDTKHHDDVFIQNYLTCTYYKIQTGEHPSVNSAFHDEVKNNMPTKYNDDTKAYFLNFFEEWGSHYVYQAVFG